MMIAHYGYEDGSGVYYISINTDSCEQCIGKDCIAACSENLFVEEEDDWGNEVVAIRSDALNLLFLCCAECKRANEKDGRLSCQKACPNSAIKHTW
jgi:Fe-S-cluster-containing hydrogenase component 2